jgi:pSer/pThr/pTyr-binding forkhead associated (FHA) protein
MLKLQFRDQPGKIVKLSQAAITLGRDESNDVVIDAPSVSDFHAEITADAQHISIVDLLSASGTFVNEHRINGRCELKAWDIIRLGTVELEVIDPGERRPEDWALSIESDLLAGQFFPLGEKTVVGRDPTCDLTIDSRLLSRRHAELTIEVDHLRVVDLGSANGTFINGEKIEEGIARPGDELRFDQERFVVLGPSIAASPGEGAEDRTVLRQPVSEATVFAAVPAPQSRPTPQPSPTPAPALSSSPVPGQDAREEAEGNLKPAQEPIAGTEAAAGAEPAAKEKAEAEVNVHPAAGTSVEPKSGVSATPTATSETSPVPISPPAAEPPAEATENTVIDTEEETRLFVPPPLRASLVPLDAGQGQAAIRLGSDTCIIGRSEECDIALPDKSVSKRHAELAGSPTHWTVRDLGSSNGVWVNGEKVGEVRLESGDRLKLGRLTFEFVAEGEGTGEREPVTRIYQAPPESARAALLKAGGTLKPEFTRRGAWAVGMVVLAAVVIVGALWLAAGTR